MRTPPRPIASPAAALDPAPIRLPGAGPPARTVLSKDSELAAAIKALVVAGQRDAARERFADLVASQQRRALRIAYHYLRDVHDADEAVQEEVRNAARALYVAVTERRAGRLPDPSEGLESPRQK